MLQQETRKKRDNDNADLERGKIEEKNREIQEAEAKKDALKKYNERVNKKMERLKKYEEFLRKVQAANQDEFGELIDILQRH